MQPLYKIPLVPQNLRREETVVQTADALKHLSDVSNDIFNCVNKRIEANTARLAAITKRIEAAQQKISKLRGAKKATQVFSSSKYPAGDVHCQYKSIFSSDHNIVLSRSKFKFKDIKVKDEALEALQFYHVKVGSNDLNGNLNSNGLGDVPVDITTVNDLLLYNTGKNPYENYVISDPLQISSRSKKEETANISNIGAAPHSITQRSTLIRPATDSYFYSPDLGNVPTIDVPLDLPDLPGIADDLRYIDQAGPGIAPSVTTTPLMPDLPPMVSESTTSINEVTPDFPTLPSPETVIIPDLEEVPPQPYEKNQEPENIEIPRTESKLDSPTLLPVINDARATLMEDIRKAGGATSTKPKNIDAKKQPTGDFMADLHAKLSLRRKGISGVKNPDPNEKTGIDSTTTMQKISAMIPPPPINVDQSDSTNTEDEDWND